MLTIWKSGVYHLLLMCQTQAHQNEYKVLGIRVFVTEFSGAVLYQPAELFHNAHHEVHAY